MAEIDQNRYDQLIRRVTGSVGPGSHVAESLAELFPVIDVENLPGELFLLSGTRLAYGGTALTPAAGKFAGIQLFNPVDSRNLITVTSVVLSVETTQTINWSLTNTALATNTTSQRLRDSRISVLDLSIGEIRRFDNVVATGANARTRVLAETPFTLNDNNGIAVLAPGSGLEFGATTAATILFCNFYWRERPAEASELQF